MFAGAHVWLIRTREAGTEKSKPDDGLGATGWVTSASFVSTRAPAAATHLIAGLQHLLLIRPVG